MPASKLQHKCRWDPNTTHSPKAILADNTSVPSGLSSYCGEVLEMPFHWTMECYGVIYNTVIILEITTVSATLWAPYNTVNSLDPGKFEWNFRHVIFKQILVIDGWDISCEIALMNVTGLKLTFHNNSTEKGWSDDLLIMHQLRITHLWIESTETLFIIHWGPHKWLSFCRHIQMHFFKW